jgi:hypothetical protein
MAKTPEYPIVCIPELVKHKKQFIPLVFPTGQGDAPIGASEGLFENVLKHYFGEIVLKINCLSCSPVSCKYSASFI